MPTLLLSTWSLPAAQALAREARRLGWQVSALDESATDIGGEVGFYGGTDVAPTAAEQFGLALLEPPLDLLARLPLAFRRRRVEYCQLKDLRLAAPTFVKPADPLNKVFDAGVYTDLRQIRAANDLDPRTPILMSEPVEWLAEYRCFILEGRVAATSPYNSFGRPVWRPYGQGSPQTLAPPEVHLLCERLLSEERKQLPPAFVVDVGLIDELGWAVVEFNPAWCSSLLGAEPKRVLPVLQRACRDARSVLRNDRRWLVARPDGS
jgi:hypothetical protein